MRILLDTHIASWAIADTAKLSNEAITLLESEKNDVPKHNDPFDRILLAQSKCENLKFITHDSLIPYNKESCVISI